MKYCIMGLLAVWMMSCSRPPESRIPGKFSDAGLDAADAPPLRSFKFSRQSPEVIRIPSRLHDSFRLTDVIDSTWLIRLETGPDFIIGQLTQLEVFNDRIIVFDQKSKGVFIFNSDGDFLNKIRPVGRGPGEFIYPVCFNIDKLKDELVIYENKMAKVLYFDLDGTFLREKHIGFRFRRFFPLPHGYLVHTHKNYNAHFPAIQNVQVIEVDSLWRPLKQGFSYSYEHQSDFNFANTRPFQLSGDELVYIPPFNDTIFSYAKGVFTPKYFLDAGSRRLPAQFDYDLTFAEFFQQYDNGRYVYFSGEAIDGQDFLYFSGKFDQNVLHGFYSKKSKKLFCSTSIETQTPPPFIMPLFGSGNILISSMDAYFFASRKAEVMESDFSAADKDLLSSLDTNDNPVLIFYRVKSF